MKSLIKRLNLKKITYIGMGIILILVANRIIQSRNTEPEALPDPTVKTISVIEFGHWSPEGRREIVGTIKSDTDIDIRAELSGTIEAVYVSIGDTVAQGQTLASFQKTNDTTQISYENLLQQLAVTKAQTASSVQAAEIGLKSAQSQLAQVERSEAQNYSRTFDLLKTQARNAESTFRNAINWVDEFLTISMAAKANINYSAQQIGRNNSIERQDLKNQLETLLRERDRIDQEQLPINISDDDALWIAHDRLTLLDQAQVLVRSFVTLIQATPVTGSLSQAQKDIYVNEGKTFVSSVDNALLSLETQIEAAKSEQGRNRLSVLGAENAVRNAEATLAVTKAQAESQITQIETQIRLAQNSQADLTVRAPFAGKITGSTVLPFDQVTAGTALFSMVGTTVQPKITTTITNEELNRIMAHGDKVQAQFEDGTIVSLPEFQVSGKINSLTQKLSVDFPLETLPESTLVGSFVKVLLPINGSISNLLPISALSFEPDGAEVLVVEEGRGVRKRVEVGKLISNAVEIETGLEIGAPVVQYRNRAHAGELLEIRK